MIELRTEYKPDSVTLPGETLLETLYVIGMTQAELATRMGRPKKTINEIIKGKKAITPETALQLELVLGIPASFWNQRESRYQESIARTEQYQQFSKWVEWLDRYPYKELVEHGWINGHRSRMDRLKEALAFFGVASPEQWEALWNKRVNLAFRRSRANYRDQVAAAAWLRKAELDALEIDCAPYDEQLFRQILRRIRSLTRRTPTPELYQKMLTEICRDTGVAVTIVPRLSKSRIFGASQWLSPQKAHIALSLYYKYDDSLWFTFFHEVAHILLHSKKEVYISIDEKEAESDKKAQEEMEANHTAGDFLIPSLKLVQFIRASPRTKKGDPFFSAVSICEFAEEIGVAPSIVVGRLHHDRLLKHAYRNELRTRLSWSNVGRIKVESVAKC